MVRKLIYINGLAIIAVVLYHASAYGFISMFWWAHRYRPVAEVNFDQFGNPEYFFLRAIEQLVIFAIPAFIFVSGYYVAVATGRNNKTVGWNTLLNRIRVLAIPFLIWSVIYIVYNVFNGLRYSAVDLLVTIFTGKATYPFYFIPLLIQLYLISPFLVLLIKKNWKPVLGVSAVIQVLVLLFRYVSNFRPDLPLFADLSNSVLFTSYLFWFVSGIVVGFSPTSFKAVLAKYKRWFLLGVFVFFLAGMIEWELIFRSSGLDWVAPSETLIDHLYAASVLGSLLAFDGLKLFTLDRLAGVGAKSFGIYLAHMLSLEFSARAIYHLFPKLMEYTLLFLPIIAAAGLGIPLLLMFMVQKLPIRNNYSYLFG